MFGQLVPFLKLLQEGSQQNWWGLGCPSHCRGPGVGALIAAFFLGILCTLGGLGSCWYLLWRPDRTASQGPSRAVISSGARRRLQAYAHEH